MFSPVLSDDAKAFFKDRATGKFKYVDGQLAGKDYLMGKHFTVADGYLFTMLAWADRMKSPRSFALVVWGGTLLASKISGSEHTRAALP